MRGFKFTKSSRKCRLCGVARRCAQLKFLIAHREHDLLPRMQQQQRQKEQRQRRQPGTAITSNEVFIGEQRTPLASPRPLHHLSLPSSCHFVSSHAVFLLTYISLLTNCQWHGAHHATYTYTLACIHGCSSTRAIQSRCRDTRHNFNDSTLLHSLAVSSYSRDSLPHSSLLSFSRISESLYFVPWIFFHLCLYK